MANWISSKLKVAESLLQQIDQQAAESLGKGDRPPELLPSESGGTGRQNLQPQQPLPETSSAADAAPRKLHLKPKSVQRSRQAEPPGRRAEARRGPQGREADSITQRGVAIPAASAASAAAEDGDWTQLLGPATRQATRLGGTSLERQRSGKRFPVLEKRRSRGDASATGDNATHGVAGTITSIATTSSASDLTGKFDGPPNVVESQTIVSSNDGGMTPEIETLPEASSVAGADLATSWQRDTGDTATISEITKSVVEGDGESNKTRMSGKEHPSTTAIEQSVPHGVSGRSSGSSEGSDSETDSLSSSGSESEREREDRRKKWEQINAEKAAEAIRARENMVAMLEGEKQSLLKILEERKKQQEVEASELQSNMMEKMEAAELEKQRHHSTRMEALAHLAALESKNAELARSLATTQWNLEKEVSRVAELHHQLEFKKLAQEDMKQKISKIHYSQLSLDKVHASGAKHEEDILHAEYSFLSDKVGQLKEKAKKTEEDIEKMRKDMEEPTKLEVELKGRLSLLTDRLIEKQTQVENLSSEKAMLLFRIETMSRLYEGDGLSSQMTVIDPMKSMEAGSSTILDIEVGKRDSSHFSRPFFSRIPPERSHLWLLAKQIDVMFSAGALFLRRNPKARLWSLVYLSCLHLWVIYVLMSHSGKSTSSDHGAVYSLENLNRTSSP